MTTTRAFKIARNESLIKSVQLDKDPFGYSISCLIPYVRYILKPYSPHVRIDSHNVLSHRLIPHSMLTIYSCDADK